MIKSFKHKGLEKFFTTGTTKGIQAKHAAKLRRILDFLHHVSDAREMNLPGFRLHPLSGDLQDHWAVKVSGNLRVTFYFEDGHAHVVNYQDYHQEAEAMEITRKPTHPGEIIKHECIEPLGMTISAFAKQLGVSRKTLSKIVNERGSVTPDMALRLSRTLGTTPNVWLNLQQAHDLWVVQHETDGWKDAVPTETAAFEGLEAQPNRQLRRKHFAGGWICSGFDVWVDCLNMGSTQRPIKK